MSQRVPLNHRNIYCATSSTTKWRKQMKSIISIAAALTIISTLTACSSGSQSESPASTTSQAATEAVESTEDAVQTIYPFENVSIEPYNEYYPYIIHFGLDTINSPYNGMQNISYNGTIISADTHKLTVEVSVDMEGTQTFLTYNNYKLSDEKKTFEVPIEEMCSFIINKDQLEMNKGTIYDEAILAVDGYLEQIGKTDVTYQLKNCIALLAPENAVYIENLPLEQEGGRPGVSATVLKQPPTGIFNTPRLTTAINPPIPNIFFCFECSDGTSCIAYGTPYLVEKLFVDMYEAKTFSVALQDSYDAGVEYIDNMIADLDAECEFEKVEFSIE